MTGIHKKGNERQSRGKRRSKYSRQGRRKARIRLGVAGEVEVGIKVERNQ